jgi:hypothetical protein
MTWLWPTLLGLSRVVHPDTILRWHRAGFRTYWRWKSHGRPGRPRVSRELRELIQRMGKENPLWGAPRIHGELLKLGFEIAESTISKYMIRRRGPPSQTWRTFTRHCGDRSLRCSNPDVRAPVCVSRVEPRSTTAALVRGDPAPDGTMAGAADRGGIPVGHGTELFVARQ